MADVNELAGFLQSLESEVTDRVHERSLGESSQIFRINVFTEIISEYLVDYGEIEDVEVCYLDKKFGRGLIRANAFNVNDEERKITLITTLYKPDTIWTIHRQDIEVSIQRSARIIEAAQQKYYEQMEVAHDDYSMMERISQAVNQTYEVYIVVISNGIKAVDIKVNPVESKDYVVKWQVWDANRIFRCVASGKEYETININFKESTSGPLPCLILPSGIADYNGYLALIPGNLLYELYERHGAKLLELNVRSFLQARGKVNRGIRDTLKNEANRFFAYNNGISVTAEKIVTELGGMGEERITYLEGFQVVNGGQTMASIHRARKIDQSSLDDVYVQAKITVVDPERMNEIVPLISRYANTQNKVNEADFSSNDPFHVELERLSEKIWCPGEQSRWFYERARGQYQVARNKIGTTPARKRQFDSAMPSIQKFDKTSLAKYLNSWNQLPHVVSLGNQKNFVYFMDELFRKSKEWSPDETYYKEMIAKGIIFKRAEKIARQHKFPAYRANAVTYTVALFAYRTIGRVNLMEIWKQQSVSDALADTLYEWMPVVMNEIIDSAGDRNVTEWCKKVECWRKIQTLDVALSKEIQGELAEGQPLPTVGNIQGQKGTNLSDEDRENIAKTMKLSEQEWLKITAWATDFYPHPSMGGIALTLTGFAASGWKKVPSAKQAFQAVKMITQATEIGLFETDYTIGGRIE